MRELFAAPAREPRRAATRPGASRSTSRAAAARPARATAMIKIEMHFLPDVYVPCEVCHGKRYNRETLEVRYQRQDHRRRAGHDGRTRHWPFFANIPSITRKLQTLLRRGPGLHASSGQPATTLSGGEAQRVKLAKELPPPADRQDLLHPRRAHHRPALRGRAPAASRCSSSLVDARQHRARHRAQPRRHQDGRPHHRHGPGGRRRGRHRRGLRHARAGRRGARRATRGRFLRQVLARDRARQGRA